MHGTDQESIPDEIALPEIELLFEQLSADVADHGYAIADNFLDTATCAALLASMRGLQEKGLLKKANIGRGKEQHRDASIRGDEILWLGDDSESVPAMPFILQLEALIQYFNRYCFAGIRDYEAHFAAYPIGAFYKRHLDQCRGTTHRKFTFIFYLNADWKMGDGGELRMYIPRDEAISTLDVAPIGGRMVCFRSDLFEHEVLPTHKIRYSITGWWLDIEPGLTFLQT
jgi:SM-20-related protein